MPTVYFIVKKITNYNIIYYNKDFTMNDIVFNGKINLLKNKEGKINSEGFSNINGNTFMDIFTQSNVILLLIFLAIYFVIYFILGVFTSSTDTQSSSVKAFKVFDFIMFGGLLIYIVLKLVFVDNYERKSTAEGWLQNFTDYIKKDTSIFSIIFFIFVFYLVIFISGIPMTSDIKPASIQLIESGAWVMFAITLISWFCTYFLGISIGDLFYKFISSLWDSLEYTGNTVAGNAHVGNANTVSSSITSQVFNISNNLYTYDDAQAICKSYGARLATYDDMENAYEQGAEWCNYGWSDGQMIYYPTQQDTWDKLQKIPSKKNNCGRPGINGGYMKNPYLRFGVNCYGKKPEPTEKDLQNMRKVADMLGPSTVHDELMDKKVKYWTDNSANLLKINSFNHNKWSEY